MFAVKRRQPLPQGLSVTSLSTTSKLSLAIGLTATTLLAGCSPQSANQVQLSAGDRHTCAIDTLSGLRCWGDNSNGQLDPPDTLGEAINVTAGQQSTCALNDDHDAICWGGNSQLNQQAPANLVNPTQISANYQHACVLDDHGVQCWGDNSANQLTAPPLNQVSAVTTGQHHSCAIDNATVICWGDNSLNQLQVPALTAPTQISAGANHTCALDNDSVVCWGDNQFQQLDAIPLVTAPLELDAGERHTCILDALGAHCWGAATAAINQSRELTWSQHISIGGTGSEAHACVQHLQGIACWGDSDAGQADYPGTKFDIVYRSEVEIDAPAEQVWAVLMDLDSYGSWNPFTVSMQSTLEVGAPMVMQVQLTEGSFIEQTEHIRVLEPGHKACWGINTATPLINMGERCQWLEPLASGGTRYVTEDLISGTANPIVTGLFGEGLGNGFDGVASGLKAYVETL